MTPRASFTKVDLGSRLEFHISYERRWLQWLIGLVILGFALEYGFKQRNWWWTLFAIIGVCGVLADFLHGSEVLLSVNSAGLEASGNLGSMFTTRVQLAADEFVSLGYEIGEEDRFSGLYARKGFGGTCIAPYVSEDMCIEIASVIYQRFPDLGTGDRRSGSLLYPESVDPITLFKRR